jgi:peptidyl-prolyl cis-trans isomerase A (cyclophilin A)
MKQIMHSIGGILLVLLAAQSFADKIAAPQTKSTVVFTTNLGDIKIELFDQEASISVKNFLQYVDNGFYQNVIFHRVIPGFVIQGGGFDIKYQRKEPLAPILNESTFSLKNLRGTLSMARTADPNSATSQFFINLQNNPSLDFQVGQPGYAVFGRVIDGMTVVDAIAAQPQGKHTDVFENAPNEPVIILNAKRYEGASAQPENSSAPKTKQPENSADKKSQPSETNKTKS